MDKVKIKIALNKAYQENDFHTMRKIVDEELDALAYHQREIAEWTYFLESRIKNNLVDMESCNKNLKEILELIW